MEGGDGQGVPKIGTPRQAAQALVIQGSVRTGPDWQARLAMVVWIDAAWSRRHGQRDSRGSIGEEWQAARGRARVRQFANWHLTAGMVPQASAPRKWHGRLGSASLGLACFGRQRSMGKDSTPPHGRRRDAYQGSICSGMTTYGRSGLEGDLWRLTAGNAAKRRYTYAWQAWLAKARIDQFWFLTAGSATSGMD